jgi:hypothetical protein
VPLSITSVLGSVDTNFRYTALFAIAIKALYVSSRLPYRVNTRRNSLILRKLRSQYFDAYTDSYDTAKVSSGYSSAEQPVSFRILSPFDGTHRLHNTLSINNGL